MFGNLPTPGPPTLKREPLCGAFGKKPDLDLRTEASSWAHALERAVYEAACAGQPSTMRFFNGCGAPTLVSFHPDKPSRLQRRLVCQCVVEFSAHACARGQWPATSWQGIHGKQIQGTATPAASRGSLGRASGPAWFADACRCQLSLHNHRQHQV